MYNIDERYGSDYIRGVEKRLWRMPEVFTASRIIYEWFRPDSVVDWGCANGWHCVALRLLGCDVCGVEGSVHWGPVLERNLGPESFVTVDMRSRIKLPGAHYSLSLCIEVLEHIEEEYSDIALDNITQCRGKLFITASSSRAGTHHINVKDKEYWIPRFEKRGFRYNDKATTKLQQKLSILERSKFLSRDLMVFNETC